MTPGTTDFIAKSKQLKELEDRINTFGTEMKGVGDALDEPNKKGGRK
ncbi:hypothetical protein [Dyadobacter fanqingshengii]|uniref:Uncharacterized protein n=1 Tax=Dyadobacter fanqingshengii TaxID=2906443 RepID=A0A9X1P9F2_9BACT|nr:hypothetical protein [Dyadobacter fanqingshengii]MCF0039748.1 hypothetical protein [Dyadobacter fanqingshengii]USJ38490.1 hypothetical protein NFI81_12055 [Dyadobacter fanqingshengii]